MDFLMFLYDILLLLLYTVPLTLGTVLYIQNKKRGYLYACILFISFIVDHVLLYMTEYIPWFFDLYNRMLLSVPTVKTMLYGVTLGSFILIFSTFVKNAGTAIFWLGLAFVMLFQLYTPLLADGPLKVWIYYFPAQLFVFCLGLYGIYAAKKTPVPCAAGQSDGHFYKILVFCTVMAAAITLEDTVVIFHFDDYTPLEMDILNRSYTQDFLNIVLSFYAVNLLFRRLPQAVSGDTHDGSLPDDHMPVADIGADIVPDVPEDAGLSEDPVVPDSRQSLFSMEYQLTAREQEILALLLDNNSNQEISDKLKISLGTTKTHTHNIFQKLGVRKRRELLELYQEFNKGQPPEPPSSGRLEG